MPNARKSFNRSQSRKPAKGLLFRAAEKGDADTLRDLLAQGADANERDIGGDTALIVAVDGDKMDCVQILLENGAEIDEPRANGQTPLITALRHRHAELALVLIGEGADVDLSAPEGEPPLVLAASEDRHALNAVACALINKGADIDATGAAGRTPLICAAWNKNTELVRFLAKKGADLNIRASINGQELTALGLAAREGYTDVVDVLREAYAERERQKTAAIQNSADKFNEGLTAPIKASKPIVLKPKP